MTDPVETRRVPKLERDEIAFLTATALVPFGALFDWGLAEGLLVPTAEQTTDVTVGGRYAIGLVLDEDEQPSGTLRVAERVRIPNGEFAVGQRVDGEAWRNDPEIGLFVIVGKRFVGLVPASEPHTLARGEAAQFRVSRVLPDGRITLTLRPVAHEAIEGDALRILAVLSAPNAPRMSDRSSPEEIRARFGLAKKAFKRAAGHLLKEGALEIDE